MNHLTDWVSVTHPHTGSTGSAERSPVDSHSGNLLACSDSRADSGDYCHIHPHLRRIKSFNISFLAVTQWQLRVRYLNHKHLSGSLSKFLWFCNWKGETARPNNFNLGTVLSWVLSNICAKREVDRMNRKIEGQKCVQTDRCKSYHACSPSHSMPVLSKEKPLEHSQLKLPGVLTQEAREPHALFWPEHSLLSAKTFYLNEMCLFLCVLVL